ncbi:MAG: ribosome assembly cofactor RimP [Prevotellaceae bacterium]|nr:ribosome assembly cofactor RimP [Prevotellaceae bacterium]
MIDKAKVQALVEQWLEGKEYFLADLQISADDRIVVEIDHADGVWIDDCVDLSRFIESGLDRDAEDFELEVGSAGIGQPFKVLRQYEIHEGERVEVLTTEGRRLEGLLTAVTPEGFVLVTQEKCRVEGKKRPVLVDVEVPLKYTGVKWTKYVVDFK